LNRSSGLKAKGGALVFVFIFSALIDFDGKLSGLNRIVKGEKRRFVKVKTA
jgi:hypothetical protein